MLSPGWGKQGRYPGGGDLEEEEGHQVWCGGAWRGECSEGRAWGWGGMPYGPLSSVSPEAPKGVLQERAGRRCVCGGLALGGPGSRADRRC